ncbi:MAG: aldo/keto reductase, partial [Methanomicrobiales archaeon]|nr:aldo/keto reductase [Methanomicrobiales archaeon]
RRKIGKAIKGNRDKLIIQGHIGSTDINQQYDVSRDITLCKKYFDSLLSDLGTDYIDFGMLFHIDNEQDFNMVFHSDIVRYAEELKRNGIIRAIGASSHDPIIAKRMVETGIVELLMFSVNPAFDMIPAEINATTYLMDDFNKSIMVEIDAKRQELYKTCERLGVPITVMKTLAGGKLISKNHTPFSKPLTVSQCIHYALTRPSAASVLIGCQSRKHVEEAVAYLEKDPSDLDYTEAICSMNAHFKGSCVYCNHCLPCSSGIDIAAVTKYLDIAIMDASAGETLQHYRELSAHGSDCIACGSCESKCPFSVPIIKNMEMAANIFGL